MYEGIYRFHCDPDGSLYMENTVYNEGNQTEYRYDIERVQTIDFDRNKLRKIIKNLYSKADSVSNDIDLELLDTKVDYEFPFDMHGDNDSIIEDYINSSN